MTRNKLGIHPPEIEWRIIICLPCLIFLVTFPVWILTNGLPVIFPRGNPERPTALDLSPVQVNEGSVRKVLQQLAHTTTAELRVLFTSFVLGDL